MRKKNPIGDFIANFTTRQLIAAAVIGAVLVAGGAGYLIYSRFYGNIGNIKLIPTVTSDIDRKKVAADNNIITGYLFSRTKHLMLEEGPDKILIPSQYTIAGRLVTQPAENTLTYRLEDQALLLSAYVKNGERGKASELRNEINKRFKAEDGSYYAAVYDDGYEGERTLEGKKTNTSQIAWLDAYLEFAASFGNNEDEKKIRTLAGILFDDKGQIRPETFTIEGYEGADAPGLVDEGDGEEDKETANDGNREYVVETVNGVKLSDVNLPLIKNLENNGYLPQGSYDKAAKIVQEAVLTDNIRLYALAYEQNGDEINYVYTTGSTGTVDVAESLKTEANLAAMGLLPASDISWISQEILNTGMIPQYYYVTSGNFSDDQSCYDAAYQALLLAYRTGDAPLYKMLTTIEGMRVATKSSSVALYMIYRQEESRFIFDAAENLGVYVACS
ncbi:MAG: hypothetical protein J6X33_10225 [Clostridiales bacterium]|nr:hypothetical protein [Clostridiales bacterium]